MKACSYCKAEYVFVVKFSGEVDLPTCDCEERITERRLNEMIEARKRRNAGKLLDNLEEALRGK